MLNIKKTKEPWPVSNTYFTMWNYLLQSKPKKLKLEHQEEKQSYKSFKSAEETIKQISNLETILNYFLSILLIQKCQAIVYQFLSSFCIQWTLETMSEVP